MTVFLRILCVVCVLVCLAGLFLPQYLVPIGASVPSAPQIQSDDSANASPDEASIGHNPAQDTPQADHDSPMIQSIDSLLTEHDQLLGPLGEQMHGDLAKAGQILQDAKRNNRRAIAQANRRQRLPGRTPQLLVILVPGLRTSELSCFQDTAEETPGFASLAERGVRLSLTAGEQASDWTVLVAGKRTASGQTVPTLVARMWREGYDTCFLGEPRLLPGTPAAHGFQDHKNSMSDTSSPEEMINSLVGESVRQCAAHRNSRPAFVLTSLPSQNWSITERDAIPQVLLSELKQHRLDRSTVVLLVGIADERNEAALSAPAFVISPGRFAAGTASDVSTTWQDLAVTLLELAEIPLRRGVDTGSSRVTDWQSPAAPSGE